MTIYEFIKNKHVSKIVYAIPSLIFLVIALQLIELPGLYMDAINPEYMIPEILYSDNPIFKKWLSPGNVIWDRFPVFSGPVYHGSLQVYATLPFLYAFGVDLELFRYFQVAIGLSVVLFTVAITKRACIDCRLSHWVPLVAGILAASDPILVFGLRTQAYSLIFPLPFFLLAWILIDIVLRSPRSQSINFTLALASGFLVGISAFSYFVYTFFSPVIIFYIFFCSAVGSSYRSRVRVFFFFLIGCFFGIGGFFAGVALIVSKLGGINEALTWWSAISSQLKVLGDSQGMFARFISVAEDFDSVLNANWVFWTVFKESHGIRFLGFMKWGFFAASIFVAFVLAKSKLIKYILASVLGYLVISAGFGSRLSGHHYTLLVPFVCLGIAYLCGVIDSAKNNIFNISFVFHGKTFFLKALCFVPIFAIFACNLNLDHRFLSRLNATGGVGLYSDAINKFAKDIFVNYKASLVYFPDWGYRMPFTFLTKSAVEYETRVDPSKLKKDSCTGRDTFVVFSNQDNYDKFELIRNISGIEHFEVTPWYQRNGEVVFEVGKYARSLNCKNRLPFDKSVKHFDVFPKALYNCDFLSRVSAFVSWDFRSSGVESVSIFVSERGKKQTLWINSTSAGESYTGPWANPGMEFTAIDLKTGRNLGSVSIEKLNCPMVENEDFGLWIKPRKKKR